MINLRRVKISNYFVFFIEFIVIGLLLISSVYKSISIIRIAIYLTFLNMMIYSLKNVAKHYLLIIFNLALFVLLLGRITFYMFDSRYNYNNG